MYCSNRGSEFSCDFDALFPLCIVLPFPKRHFPSPNIYTYKREVFVCLFVCYHLKPKLQDGSQPKIAMDLPLDPAEVLQKLFWW